MLIESTILYKNYLAIAYDDGISLLNPKTALKNFEHLNGIEKMPNLFLCKEKINLEKSLISTFLNRKLDKNKIDKVRKYFLFNEKDKSYFQVVRNNIDEILS